MNIVCNLKLRNKTQGVKGLLHGRGNSSLVYYTLDKRKSSNGSQPTKEKVGEIQGSYKVPTERVKD